MKPVKKKIEPANQIEQSLRNMYELGVEHGRTLAERDLKIEQLKKEVEKLAPKTLLEESEDKNRSKTSKETR